jgi:hypothetical protein
MSLSLYFDLRLLFPLRTYNLRHLKGPTPAPSEVTFVFRRCAPWRHYSPSFFSSRRAAFLSLRARLLRRRFEEGCFAGLGGFRWMAPAVTAGQVDACLFRSWLVRAGRSLSRGAPLPWPSELVFRSPPSDCGLARWARRRPRWDSWNLVEGGEGLRRCRGWLGRAASVASRSAFRVFGGRPLLFHPRSSRMVEDDAHRRLVARSLRRRLR